MKRLSLIAGLCATALLGACTVYEPATYTYAQPAPRVAYVTPAAPAYVVVP